jgi:hypothetical protein
MGTRGMLLVMIGEVLWMGCGGSRGVVLMSRVLADDIMCQHLKVSGT